MAASLHITFLGMTRSPAVEAQIQRWVERLDKSFDRLVRCDVWVEQPHQHNRKGNTFRVRVELSVPGDTLVVSRDAGVDQGHENVYVAISDAFRAARRQLRNFAQRLLSHAA
jgi:ribosome-associated translation inhibitor RaiA